jgi:hypothetical protein
MSKRSRPDLGREWLVTNGLGGDAAGPVSSPDTRRYHALLDIPLALQPANAPPSTSSSE